MILRKPYAFLIKHFKKIHLLLGLLSIFIAYKINNIYVFFKDFISSGTYVNEGTSSLVSKYISAYLYLSIIVIVLATLTIYILMRLKKKPKLFYLIVILFYLIVLIFLSQVGAKITTLEVGSIGPQELRVYRDIALIVLLLNYAFAALLMIRGVGFSIKKFNFGEDLQKLEIEATDNEEFELTVGIDTRTIARKLRHQKRELKYFIVENIFILTLISTVVIVFLSVSLFLNFEVYNKVYKEHNNVNVNGLLVKVNDCYYTKKDYQGNKIAPNGSTYVVVNLTITNRTKFDLGLLLDNFALTNGSSTFYEVHERYQYFFDLGTGYNNDIIKPNKTYNYILLFQVNDNAVNNLTLRYTTRTYFSANELMSKYKKIKLISMPLDKVSTVGTTKLGEKMWLGESIIKDSSLSINNVEINDIFNYQTTICAGSSCDTYNKLIMASDTLFKTKTLLKIGITYKLDKSISYMGLNNFGELVKDFGEIKYIVDNKTYYTKFIDVTPSDYDGNDIYLETTSAIKQSSNLSLILTIRDKRYVYLLNK